MAESEEVVEDVPTASFDFKAIPTMAAREHSSCYTSAFACPGQSTKEEEYSNEIVHKCDLCVESLGYKRVAMKSDQEEAMQVLKQRVRK